LIMKFQIVLLLLAISFASSLPFNAGKCGEPAVKPDTSPNFIVSGREAIPYSWPWQVVMFNSGSFFCGGTIISNNWIMTAAHCVTGKRGENIRAKAGVFRKDKDDEPGEQLLSGSEIFVHPKYDAQNIRYDVALLKLKEPVKFTAHISPICLPKLDEDMPKAAGSTVFVTGWGDVGNGQVSPTLRQVGIALVPQEECKASDQRVDERVNFCGSYGDKGFGPYYGDSGGPAAYQDPTNGIWRQLGIISRNNPKFNVYSRVSGYIDFIQEHVKDM